VKPHDLFDGDPADRGRLFRIDSEADYRDGEA
jgi:hypothetical protein